MKSKFNLITILTLCAAVIGSSTSAIAASTVLPEEEPKYASVSLEASGQTQDLLLAEEQDQDPSIGEEMADDAQMDLERDDKTTASDTPALIPDEQDVLEDQTTDEVAVEDEDVVDIEDPDLVSVDSADETDLMDEDMISGKNTSNDALPSDDEADDEALGDDVQAMVSVTETEEQEATEDEEQLDSDDNAEVSPKIPIANATIEPIKPRVYEGRAFKPAVIVTYQNKTLVKGTDYTVSYKSNTKVGTAKVIITGKGAYTGTGTMTFWILPKSTTVSSVKPGKTIATVKWKKQSAQVSGYQIQYSRKKSFSNKKTVTVKNAKTTSRKLSGLTSGKNYYVRIRTYKKVGDRTYYSSWSKKKAFRTNASNKQKAVKELRPNKTYSINLNGGSAKEKVSYSWNEGRLTIKVNGKKAWSKKIYGSFTRLEYLWALAWRLDYDTNDKYQELLFVMGGEPDAIEEILVFRYYEKGKVKSYIHRPVYYQASIGRLYDSSDNKPCFENTGNNKLYIWTDTPFGSGIGYYYAKVPIKLKNDEISVIKQDTYSLRTFSTKNLGKFITGRSFVLYKDHSKSSKQLCHLKPGTVIKPKKIAPLSLEKDAAMFVYVETSGGRKGWIYFPAGASSKDYMRSTQGWG